MPHGILMPQEQEFLFGNSAHAALDFQGCPGKYNFLHVMLDTIGDHVIQHVEINLVPSVFFSQDTEITGIERAAIVQ